MLAQFSYKCMLLLLFQSQDHQTPSPGVQYVNCPPDQQPRQNGNHVQPGQATPLATPHPPSSLALGYSQRSHTGRTPLIALTPDTDQPFPNAATVVHPSCSQTDVLPSYSQTVGAAYDDTVEHRRSNGEYAAVGISSGVGGSQRRHSTSPCEMGGGPSVPIYSNSTISDLANDVQLQGAEMANQTDV